MKILLFDDHRIFGESLSKLLEDWDEISICRYVSNETEFWNILSVDEWDIVLLDVNLRDQSKNSGIDLIEKIYNKNPFTIQLISKKDNVSDTFYRILQSYKGFRDTQPAAFHYCQ